ncbi:DNA internalization-related competence protein ComEC/Rec2 [Bacillus smithii]|uniref:DNA internalization-related competence protein ComEC/Rec2 n=1 Tax=Bacillus smithii TaxID=1479 RepID=UPI00065E1867|nr:DNA internalization-related competence protein ComEC/Rec2 [Bacillus smithii]AKP47879.1 Late competence protein ComEC DNA transport [Bacillus smithii]
MKGNILYFAVFSLFGSIWALPRFLGSVRLFLLMICLFLLFKLPKTVVISLLAVSVFFYLATFIRSSHHHSLYVGTESNWTVSFQQDMTFDGDQLKARVISQDGEKLELRYTLHSPEEKQLLQQKLVSPLVCSFSGKLLEPSTSRNENSFDYKTYLSDHQIYWIIEPIGNIRLDDCYYTKPTFLDRLQKMRAQGIQLVMDQFPQEMKAVAAALLFGDQSKADEELMTAYQKLGIIHLLAVSGLHVQLIAGAFFYLLIRLGVTRETSAWILLFLLPLYAVMTGGSPPVVRSVLMTSFLLLASLTKRGWTSLDAIGASFMLVILYDPFLLYHIGLQLSYMVSVSLLLSSPLISRLKSALGKSFAITLISQASSIPLLLYHFYEISIISLAANLFFVPFYSFLMMPLSLFSFLFLKVAGGLPPPVQTFSWLFGKINQFAEDCGNLPFATIVTGKPNEFFLFLYMGAVFFFFFLWEKYHSMIKASLLLAAVLVVHLMCLRMSPYGEVTFIDVGQGDSIFIHLPFHKGNYLIDTGGHLPFQRDEWQEKSREFSVGRDILVPYLKSKGITEIDKLILTHGDYDHVGAATEIIPAVHIREIIITPGSEKDAIMKRIIRLAFQKQIKVTEGIEGQGWNTGNFAFLFLSPDDSFYEGNNDSLVLYAKIGGLRWLFTGDLEKEGEAELVQQWNLKADILKVGHHGSKTSTSPKFLEAVNPKIAVISVGVKNRYGHPHPEVIRLLEEQHINVFRTDLNGQITYKFYKEKGTFQTHFP